jgi:Tn3 transposase DDE domain
MGPQDPPQPDAGPPGAPIAALRAEGEDVPDDQVAHLSPVTWEQVNFLGPFTFTPAAARALDDRRPLRGGADEDGLDETAIL